MGILSTRATCAAVLAAALSLAAVCSGARHKVTQLRRVYDN